MMDPSTDNRHAPGLTARSRSLRLVAAFSCMAALAPSLLACEGRRELSVGKLPCSDDERVRCEPHARERLDPVLVQLGPDGEAAAEIVWDHALEWAPAPCASPSCATDATDFIVHDDGEVTLAGVFRDETRTELWVSWLDADGRALFATMLPEESEWLRGGLVTQLTLSRDADGSALLLVVRAGSKGGTLRALAIARSGQVETMFAVDTGKAWPHTSALLGSDVIIAPTNQELARYRRGGELRWRQTQLAWIPGQQELGLMFDEDSWVGLRGLAVDGRDRIWAALSEGAFGIAQLDPDGVVAWHGLLPTLSFEIEDAAFSTPIAIDSRDRPIVGFGQAIVRFDPEASDEQRRAPLGSSGLQESYYPQSVDGLDVDTQDRMYVATQDGPRSQRRLLVERVSEDFRQRDRFVIPFAPIDTIGHVLRGLQLAGNGDAYVRLVPDGSVPEQTDIRIVRVRLAAP